MIVEFTGSKRSHYIHVIPSGNYTWPSNWRPKPEMLREGDEFKSLTELLDKISDFERTECVQLYIRRSRSITSAAKR